MPKNGTDALRLLALGSALLHVLLEGLALADGALLAEGVVVGRHRGGVVGVGLLVTAPPGVDLVTSILRGAIHARHGEGGEAALDKSDPVVSPLRGGLRSCIKRGCDSGVVVRQSWDGPLPTWDH